MKKITVIAEHMFAAPPQAKSALASSASRRKVMLQIDRTFFADVCLSAPD